MTRIRFVLLACVLGSLMASAALAGSARAADRVYWGNYGNGTISFANLDGSGGGDVNTAGATLSHPRGLSLDPAGGRVYWVDEGETVVSFADLDGTGGGTVNTTGATVSTPAGIAVAPTTGRLYWANQSPAKISFANLDGSGGGDITITGATVDQPGGVAIDPAAGKIYWANIGANKISFANLDGSNGGDVNTTGATVDIPEGVAVDTAAGRIYWSNQGMSDGISFANLDGSGGGNLNTTGATLGSPVGVALDPIAGRIYWGDFSANTISFANLDGSGGGGDLAASGASADNSNHPALLKTPAAVGAPVVAGGSAPGSILSCSTGNWAGDLVPAALYRAPQSFAFQWSLGGSDIAGATTSTYTTFGEGEYRCKVTASNAAGGTTQTSAPHAIGTAASVGFGARTLVTLKLAAGRIPARGPLRVRVSNANGFGITGSLSGRTVSRVEVARKRRVRLKAKAFSVAANARKTVRLRLPKSLRRVLRRERKLKLRMTAKVKDPAGLTRTVRKRVTPKLRAKRRR